MKQTSDQSFFCRCAKIPTDSFFFVWNVSFFGELINGWIDEEQKMCLNALFGERRRHTD